MNLSGCAMPMYELNLIERFSGTTFAQGIGSSEKTNSTVVSHKEGWGTVWSSCITATKGVSVTINIDLIVTAVSDETVKNDVLNIESSIASMSVSNNLRVVTNNSRAVVNLCGGCVALGGECFLTLFNISCVNNSLADRAGNLALILYWPLVALPVLLVNTLRTSGVSRLSFTL